MKKKPVSTNLRRIPPTPNVHELRHVELTQARGGGTPPTPPAPAWISWD